MWMLVDDRRNLETVDIIARNSQAAMEILLGMGHRLTGLVLDFDLGEVENIGGKGRRSREITGYDVLMFAIVNEVLPLTVQIISDNPVGVMKLHNTLVQDAKYVKKVVCSHGRTRVTYVKPDEDEIVK